MGIANANATFSGDSNQGVLVGSNSGHMHFNYGVQPAESPPKLTPSSTVPFRRDPDFVERDCLAQVEERCSKPSSRVALYGLGGVGKSQVAIGYSYRVREKSPQIWVFWVYASNAARFKESYRTIANPVKLPGRDEPTADILQLVSDWLCNEIHGQWVMILDNADDPNVFFKLREGRVEDVSEVNGAALPLSAYLPQTPNGSMLITSRTRDAAARLTGRDKDIIKVEPMEESQALELFAKKTQSGFDDRVAIKLVRALDYMPLAISQAAAYINQRAPRITVMRYLEEFNKSESKVALLLNKDAGDLWRDREASNSILRTWQISFEHIRDQRPSAARLLSLMSLCDRQGIPAFLLSNGYEDDRSRLDVDHNVDTNIKDDEEDDEEDDGKDFEDDIWTLTNYFLIRTTDGAEDLFEMHRMVQLSTRRWLELHKESEKWKEKYVFKMSMVFPDSDDYQNWAICQVLLPHAQLVLAYQPVTNEYLEHWTAVLTEAGWYAKQRGDYLTAEMMIQRALESREKVLGVEHPDTLTGVHNLASVLQNQGKYEAAEKLYRQVLESEERMLGVEHPDTLNSVHCLAYLLHTQQRYDDASVLYLRALTGYRKVLGPDHPTTQRCSRHCTSMIRKRDKHQLAIVEAISRDLEAIMSNLETMRTNLQAVISKFEAAGKLMASDPRVPYTAAP